MVYFLHVLLLRNGGKQGVLAQIFKGLGKNNFKLCDYL